MASGGRVFQLEGRVSAKALWPVCLKNSKGAIVAKRNEEMGEKQMRS